MFPWKSTIQLDRQASTALYLQLANSITSEIMLGRLRKGLKMPGSRMLASTLEVNRKTVIQAYDELIAQGWLEVIPSKGTFVSAQLPFINPHPIGDDGAAYPSAQHLPLTATGDIVEYQHIPPHAIEINDGSPDHRLAPVEWIYKECRSLVKSKAGQKFLKYADVQGEEQLRHSLSQYLSETRGMKIGKENILITRGSQMGIYLIFNALLQKSDSVVVGDTSYDAADWCIEHQGARLVRIPVDQKGLQVDHLEQTLRSQKVKAVYITPHHHFPTTVTLAPERRVKLLELALTHNFAILEDDYDYDFHYASSPILPLASLHHQGHVIYIGSFSKILAPSIRIGYVVASTPIIKTLSKLRRIMDRQGDPVMEHVISQAITSGELKRHLKKSVKTYHHRRDLFCTLLQEKMGACVNFKIPEGGMAVWTEFSPDISVSKISETWLQRGLYLNVDKRYIRERNALRLGFASLNDEEIEKAMGIMGDR